MKKILIATACAFSLCLTSCASKKAPADNAQTQTQAPELEENTSDQTEESQSEDTSDDSQNQDDQTDEAEVSLEIITDNFPEPESFEEPEVITLEPAEEAEPAETESQAPAEEVEKEEPPAIAEEKPETEASSSDESENQNANEDSEITGPSDSDDDGITVIGGGIDITDDDSASDEKYNENEEDITPSRSVTLKKFEYLDITYPGTGWIYMGLIDNSKDLAYFGRKLGTKDTKFSLQARNAGKKIVHFYRNDPLTGKYLDDYIEVVILSENGSNKTHIEAPEYKLPVQKKENPVKKVQAVEEEKTETSEKSESTEKIEKSEVAKTSANTKTSAAATSSKTTSNATSATTNAKPAASTAAATTSAKSDTSDAIEESTDEAQTMNANTTAVDSSTLLKEAQLLYDEKEYAASLKKLNQFFEYSTDNRDEALYLKGQILEAKSDVRDIKGAIDAYTTLTKNYPASKLWDSANKRIIYLKRFYLEVR